MNLRDSHQGADVLRILLFCPLQVTKRTMHFTKRTLHFTKRTLHFAYVVSEELDRFCQGLLPLLKPAIVRFEALGMHRHSIGELF